MLLENFFVLLKIRQFKVKLYHINFLGYKEVHRKQPTKLKLLKFPTILFVCLKLLTRAGKNYYA